jgi:hypothetical protein
MILYGHKMSQFILFRSAMVDLMLLLTLITLALIMICFRRILENLRKGSIFFIVKAMFIGKNNRSNLRKGCETAK